MILGKRSVVETVSRWRLLVGGEEEEERKRAAKKRERKDAAWKRSTLLGVTSSSQTVTGRFESALVWDDSG